MRHILGMVKSQLDLNGAKSQKLELDYLRLVYAVKEIKKRGDYALGYLAVLAPSILDRVKHWEAKYQAEGCVKVINIHLSSSDKSKLKEEKTSNIAGMVTGAMGGEAGERSSANFGRKTGENALRKKIFESEQNVEEIMDKTEFPLRIQWDFYGVVDKS